MAQRTDVFELGRLGLHSGEARRLDLEVAVEALTFGGQTYEARPHQTDVVLDVARTTQGYSLRLRYTVELVGPCARCLEDAGRAIQVDAREVDQPGGGDELSSPYFHGDDLDLRGWVRDSLALAVPTQILCDRQCRGLCAICGENLNRASDDHRHEPPRDPRWAKLRELKLD